MLPEVIAACARLNISLLPDTDDCEGGYAFIDEGMRAPRAWDVLSKIKTAYLNCVNGVAFQNEQIGILVADLKARRGELAVLKAKRELHSLVSSLESPSSCTTTLASDESEVSSPSRPTRPQRTPTQRPGLLLARTLTLEWRGALSYRTPSPRHVSVLLTPSWTWKIDSTNAGSNKRERMRLQTSFCVNCVRPCSLLHFLLR